MKKLFALLATLCLVVACNKPPAPVPPPAPMPTATVVPNQSASPTILHTVPVPPVVKPTLKPAPKDPVPSSGGQPGYGPTAKPRTPKPVPTQGNYPHQLPPKSTATPKACTEGETKGVSVGGQVQCFVCHNASFVPAVCKP
jgi:hypothetical protein